jgi:hypothetical protein
LTAIFAIGGTRTTYILKHNRSASDPGAISDFMHYTHWTMGQYFDLMRMYFDLGGQNFITTPLSYQRFDYERGEQYTAMIAASCHGLIDDYALAFYREVDADPYFVGIDTLFQFPERKASYELGEKLAHFQQTWAYQPHRRKIVWEIAPISMFSMWRAQAALDPVGHSTLDDALAAAPNLESVCQTIYDFYARVLYGTDMPMPQLYVGSNRNGDLKMRAFAPMTLYTGSPMRLYYTPYPTLFLTRDTLAAIMEDAAFGKTLSARTTPDYTGKFTPELAEAEYQRMVALAADPDSVLGWTRKISDDD